MAPPLADLKDTSYIAGGAGQGSRPMRNGPDLRCLVGRFLLLPI